MFADTLKGRALSFVLMKPARFRLNAGYPLVILLHDFGASMYDVTGIASGMNDRGYVYACPNGPYGVTYGLGTSGYSWFPPGDAAPDASPPVEQLDVFVNEARELAGVEEGRIALVGFGDGAEVALRYGLIRPNLFTGVASLSGTVADAEELRRLLPSGREQRVFIAQTSRSERTIKEGRDLKQVLEEEGYSLFYREYESVQSVVAKEEGPDGEEYGMVPEGPRRDLPDLIAWLKETLPPL